MISPESFPELVRHAKAGAISNRRFSSVTRTVISRERGPVGSGEGRVPIAWVAALAASPAAENLRKSRLVRCVDILPPNIAADLRIRVSYLSNQTRDAQRVQYWNSGRDLVQLYGSSIDNLY